MLILVLGLCTAFTAVHSGQSPPETAGTIILLAAEKDIPLPRVEAALAHQDPSVRAAAARLVSVFGIVPAQESVRMALARETGETAGAELVRALLYLGGTEALPIVDPAVRRLGGETVLTLSEWLVRSEPARFATVMPDLQTRLAEAHAARFAAIVAGADAPKAQWPPVASRVLPVWLAELIRSTSDAAGCSLRSGEHFGYFQINYRPDGRPRKIAIDSTGLSKECSRALSALARTTLADEDRPVPVEQWIIVPFTNGFADCTRERVSKGRVHRIGSDIPTPDKIKDVRPDYPLALQRQGVQGMVIQQGVISSKGCVSSLRVIKSATPMLDLVALKSTVQWLFSPSRVDGTPVAVVMTITTNFKVQ